VLRRYTQSRTLFIPFLKTLQDWRCGSSNRGPPGKLKALCSNPIQPTNKNQTTTKPPYPYLLCLFCIISLTCIFVVLWNTASLLNIYCHRQTYTQKQQAHMWVTVSSVQYRESVLGGLTSLKLTFIIYKMNSHKTLSPRGDKLNNLFESTV
jgi:hypothetical protein